MPASFQKRLYLALELFKESPLSLEHFEPDRNRPAGKNTPIAGQDDTS